MFDEGHEAVGLNPAVVCKVAPDDRGGQDGLGARGLCLIHIACEIGSVGGGGIGFAFRTFAGAVIVAELNDDVVRLGLERQSPGAFVEETLGAAAVASMVEDFDAWLEGRAETGAPATTLGDGGIADQKDTGAGVLSWDEGGREREDERNEDGGLHIRDGTEESSGAGWLSSFPASFRRDQ